MRHLLPLAFLMLLAAAPNTGDVVRLWPGRAPQATGDDPKQTPTLTCFPPAPGTANGSAIVVCPGGGYISLVKGYEGADVARWLAQRGVYAVMLSYRVRVQQPAPLLDAQRAVRTLRSNAAAWGIDPRRIGIMGFSAGGHLASLVGTHFDAGDPRDVDPVQTVSSRPDFMVLVYPVITMKAGVTHAGSRKVLLGPDPAPALVDRYSSELQVAPDTPPTFLVASVTDTIVPVQNSRLFAAACRAKNVPVEYHEFPTGQHGFGMALTHPELNWTDPLLAWMKTRGITK